MVQVRETARSASKSRGEGMDERDDGGLVRSKEGKEVWGLTERLLSYDPES